MNSLKQSFDPETFDRERGNVLVLQREYVAPFYQLPWDIAGPIFHALLQWFFGASEEAVKMKDPRDQMVLAQLIEHTKANAENHYQRQMHQREIKSHAGKVSASKRATRANTCQHVLTGVAKEKEKEEDKDPEGISLYSSSLTCPTSSVGSESQLPSAGACAGARPAAVESGHAMRTATIAGWDEHGDETFDEGDLRERPVQFVLDTGIDEDENRARPFYLRALQQLGPEVYAETCWRFIEAYVAAANAYGKTMRELEANWDANEAKYTAQGATWDSIIAKAEDQNWHCIKTEREYYEKHSVCGGRILAGMLKEAGLAHGIDLGANRSKKGGDK